MPSPYEQLLAQFEEYKNFSPEVQSILGKSRDELTTLLQGLDPDAARSFSNPLDELENQFNSLISGNASVGTGINKRIRELAKRRGQLRKAGKIKEARKFGRRIARLEDLQRQIGASVDPLDDKGREIASILRALGLVGDPVSSNPSPNPNPGGGTGGGSGGTGGGGGGGSGNTGGGGGQVTIPGGGGGGTTPPVSDPGTPSATQVITQPGTAGNTLNDLLSQFGPDSVIANFNDSANRIRERVGGLANAQRQGITNDALGRGVGAAGFTQQRLDQSGRDELGAYGQALSQLANDFESRRIAAGGVAGDIGGKLLQGEQFNRQINLDKLTGDRNFQLGKATINNNNLNALLQALLGQIG